MKERTNSQGSQAWKEQPGAGPRAPRQEGEKPGAGVGWEGGPGQEAGGQLPCAGRNAGWTLSV